MLLLSVHHSVMKTSSQGWVETFREWVLTHFIWVAQISHVHLPLPVYVAAAGHLKNKQSNLPTPTGQEVLSVDRNCLLLVLMFFMTLKCPGFFDKFRLLKVHLCTCCVALPFTESLDKRSPKTYLSPSCLCRQQDYNK